MSLNAKGVIEVGVGLALWFGFIINMAIATGLRREMQLDVENDKSRIVGSREPCQKSYVNIVSSIPVQ